MIITGRNNRQIIAPEQLLLFTVPQTFAACPLTRQSDQLGSFATCRHPRQVRSLETNEPLMYLTRMPDERTAG